MKILRPIASSRILTVTVAALSLTLAVKAASLLSACLLPRTDVVLPKAHAESMPSQVVPSGGGNPAGTGALAPTEISQADICSQLSENPPITEAERKLLEDLRSRRLELDRREEALQERETLLSAFEARMKQRGDELNSLKSRLEELEAARKERDDRNWQDLAKLYENMKPKDAATIFDRLDMPILLQIVDRIKGNKAAMILAAMSPERARQVTAGLAQIHERENTPRDPSGTPHT